jgi:hypothetical protein
MNALNPTAQPPAALEVKHHPTRIRVRQADQAEVAIEAGGVGIQGVGDKQSKRNRSRLRKL